MTRVRVKVCGLTREEDVAAAVEAGADAVGFISGFPDSPRNLTLSRAGQLMKGVPPFIDTVLVTRSETVRSSSDQILKLRASALQIYGPVPDPRRLRERLGLKLILPHLMAEGGNGLADARGFDAVLSDTYQQGRFGGTGRVSDWEACRRLKDAVAPIPIILSGGLNPNNVASAVSLVGPFAVDVSSGVESAPGIKDHAKVRAFVRSATGGR